MVKRWSVVRLFILRHRLDRHRLPGRRRRTAEAAASPRPPRSAAATRSPSRARARALLHPCQGQRRAVHFLVDTGATGGADRRGCAAAGIPFSSQRIRRHRARRGGHRPRQAGHDQETSTSRQEGRATSRAPCSKGPNMSLLGQSYLSRIGEVQMRGDYMVLRVEAGG